MRRLGPRGQAVAVGACSPRARWRLLVAVGGLTGALLAPAGPPAAASLPAGPPAARPTGSLSAPALSQSEGNWPAPGVVARVALTEPVTWTAVVADACGTTRRTLGDLPAPAGPLEVGWDGRDDGGAPVPPGAYTLTLRTLGSGGRQDLAVLPFRVAATGEAPGDPCTVPAVAPASFTLIGSGWGHGVGMSQYGALGQARAGRGAAEILSHYYPGASLSTLPVNQPLRVSLADAAAGILLRGEPVADGGGAVSVVLDGGPEVLLAPGEVARVLPVGGRLQVTRGGAEGVDAAVGEAASVLLRWSGTTDPAGAGGAPGVLTLATTTGSATALRGARRYRYGTVELSAHGSGVRAVTTLRLGDEYLLGVGEVPSSWPEAALQAQVVAARSYALARYGSGAPRPACGCHVEATTADQAFVGWSKEAGADGQRWRAAVLATMAPPDAGSVLTFEGRPIAAYYSAASGGRTQRAEDAWGGAVAWAQSVADPWSLDPANPHASWQVALPQARIAGLLGLPDVARLAISARHVSGAVARVTGTATTGQTASLTGEQLRVGLGLRSRYLSAIVPAGQPTARYAPPHGTGSLSLPPAAPAPAAPGVPAGPVATTPPPPAAPAAPPAAPVPVGRTVTIRLRSPSPQLAVGDRVELRGTVTGIPGRARVAPQLRIAGRWQTAEMSRARTDGRYRLRLAVPGPGMVRYRVAVLDREGRIRLVSETLRLTVARS